MNKSLLIILILCGLLLSVCNASNLRFNYVSIEDGLSQATVLSILQDKQGFMWFATQDGLNRFDGYDFKTYRKDPQDPYSISENYVNYLYQDSTGYIWVSTRNGLNRFDPRTNQFKRFFHQSDDPYSISSDWSFAVNEDRHGSIWVGTYDNGLNVYNPNTGRFAHYRHDPNDIYSLSSDAIYDIFIDRTGVMWVATRNGGVNRYNNERDSFTRFEHDPNDDTTISSNRVYRIFQHSDGSMWFATRGGGLNRFNADDETFTHFRHDVDVPTSISSDQVWSIVEDRNGDLLVGTFADGLNRWIYGTDKFQRIEYNPSFKFSLPGNSIISSFADNTGLLWFGVRDAGVVHLNQDVGIFNHYYRIAYDETSLSDNSIQDFVQIDDNTLLVATREGGVNRFDLTTEKFSLLHQKDNPNHQILTQPINQLMKDNKGNLWITFKEHGFARYDLQTAEVEHFSHDPADSSGLSDNSVIAILLDPDDKIWLGTRKGLNRFDPVDNSFEHFFHQADNPNTISNDWITDLIFDRFGDLWIGTHNGVNRLELKTQIFSQYRANAPDGRGLSSNSVMSLALDSKAQLWVSTTGGLNQFDYQTETFSHIVKEDGLSNDQVYGMVEDAQGLLWLVTNFGLNRYDPKDNTVKSFTEQDGLQSNEFNQGAFYRLKDNRLVFGGVNGFNLFDPTKISDNPYPPKVTITNFRIFNQSVPVGLFEYQQSSLNVLEQSISHTQNMTLTHKESVFSFEFSAMHFAASSRNQYAYRLLGFDQQWTYTDYKNRRATYTNLAAGHYVFEVKASNKDGLWSPAPATVNLTILAPWWLTQGAKFLWLGLFFVLIFVLFRVKTRRIQLQKGELQAQVTRQVAQVVAQKQALERSYNDIKIISAIGQKINASLDMEKVLMSVYEHINQLMDGTVFGIGIYEPEKHQISVELAMEKGNRYKPYCRTMNDKNQFPVWCIENNEVIFVNDLELDGRRYLETNEYDNVEVKQQVFLEDGAYAGPPQSLIYVPIRSTDKILGFITVQSFNKHAYQEVHVDILNTLAAYTGTAIINSLEHQRLMDSRKELIESEKMASLGMLVAGVAHEINTPIGICLTTASHLQDQTNTVIELKETGRLTTAKFDHFNQVQLESLELLMNNLQKTSELIGHFKNVVVNHSIEVKSKFNVHDLLQDTINTMDSDLKNNRIDLELICEQDITANTYASSLSRVISTLVMNSILHAFADFEQPADQQGKITIYARLGGAELLICYKDNGKGMDEKLASQIFEPFYTTKRGDGCLGLGMHVVYNQVTQGLHGTVKSTSSLNEGMQIDISIPIQNYE